MNNLIKSIALVGIGSSCHRICENALKRFKHSAELVLTTDISGIASICLYKKANAKKIAQDLINFDAVLLVAHKDDSDSINCCSDIENMLDKCVCYCDFSSNDMSLSLSLARLFSDCNLAQSTKSELFQVIELLEKSLSASKINLSLKDVRGFIADEDLLKNANQALVVIKSKKELSLDKYEELAFALMSKLGDGIDISFATIQDDSTEARVCASLYLGYFCRDMDFDRTNYTKM